MKSIKPLVLVVACLVAAPFAALMAKGVSSSQMKACHDRVWERPKFSDIPNAGISITSSEVQPNGNAKVHWKVDWDNNHARGWCAVDSNNEVVNFQEGDTHQDYEHGEGTGIYYDTTSRRWKTDDGKVCHTCTADNGFPKPATDGNFYYDSDERVWRDSHERGAVCHTCTPANGFETPR